MEAHGGKIWAENITDYDGKKGATFTFSIPLSKGEQEQEQKEKGETAR